MKLLMREISWYDKTEKRRQKITRIRYITIALITIVYQCQEGTGILNIIPSFEREIKRE